MLRESRNDQELFFLDSCDTESLLLFEGKAEIEFPDTPNQDQWRELGGKDPRESVQTSDSGFVCSLWYDSDLGRFEYPEQDPFEAETSKFGKFCKQCDKDEKDAQYLFMPHKKIEKKIVSVKWDNNILKEGDCVYLKLESFNMMKLVSLTKTTQATRMNGTANVLFEIPLISSFLARPFILDTFLTWHLPSTTVASTYVVSSDH